jgi:hypothetical protein
MPRERVDDDLNDRLLTLLEKQNATMQESVERSRPRENPNYKASSIFLKPSGEPWATDLKSDVYLGSIYFNDSPLTQDEVAALNRLAPLPKGTITKNDGSTLLVSVLPKADAVGRINRLTITPYVAPGQNPGDAKFEKNLNLLLPSIASFANELANQAEAVTVG